MLHESADPPAVHGPACLSCVGTGLHMLHSRACCQQACQCSAADARALQRRGSGSVCSRDQLCALGRQQQVLGQAAARHHTSALSHLPKVPDESSGAVAGASDHHGVPGSAQTAAGAAQIRVFQQLHAWLPLPQRPAGETCGKKELW